MTKRYAKAFRKSLAPYFFRMRAILPLLLAATPALSDPSIFEDFQGEVAGWQYVSDRVMGGVSDGEAVLAQDGDVIFARLTGKVSTANNGGFVQMRRGLTAPLPTDSTGLTLTVRGNGERYFVHLRTTEGRRPWQYFQAAFPSTVDWQEVTIPWSAFQPAGGLSSRLKPTDIRSIGIVAYGRDHTADLSVAQIVVNQPKS
ncbi:MAG: CIA30 family protein [Pseudomonadota bacterium]